MKLTKRQLTALQESIYHWYENLYLALSGQWFSIDADDCALCREFGHNCRKCPVAMQTRRIGCYGSPYDKIHGLVCLYSYDYDHPAIIDAICDEIHFLESLDTGD